MHNMECVFVIFCNRRLVIIILGTLGTFLTWTRLHKKLTVHNFKYILFKDSILFRGWSIARWPLFLATARTECELLSRLLCILSDWLPLPKPLPGPSSYGDLETWRTHPVSQVLTCRVSECPADLIQLALDVVLLCVLVRAWGWMDIFKQNKCKVM